MENEAEAFGNSGIEEVAAAANDDDQEADSSGRLKLEEVVDDDLEAIEEDDDGDDVEAAEEVDDDGDDVDDVDAAEEVDDDGDDDDDDDVEAAEDLDDVEAHLLNRLHHIAVVDLDLYNPDAAAVGRVVAIFRDTTARLDAMADELRAARADLEVPSRRAAAANAAPVLPGTEQEAARARARQALEEAQLDVEDLVEHRRVLLQIVLCLVLVRAVAVSLSRMRLLPAVLLAFIAAEFIVAYASRGAYVVGGTSNFARFMILTMLWLFGY